MRSKRARQTGWNLVGIAVTIVMGKTDPDAASHAQQSQIIVPADTPGFRVERMLSVFGYDEKPIGHAEVVLENVRVPVENLIAGEGRGFEIAQGRLGPGRIHHCMRTIGAAERALELMVTRLLNRTAFKKQLAEHSVWEQRVAEARTNIEMCRLLVLKAAWMMDQAGAKNARSEIAQIKVAAPRMALQVIDDAIQAFGGAGVSAGELTRIDHRPFPTVPMTRSCAFTRRPGGTVSTCRMRFWRWLIAVSFVSESASATSL